MSDETKDTHLPMPEDLPSAQEIPSIPAEGRMPLTADPEPGEADAVAPEWLHEAEEMPAEPAEEVPPSPQTPPPPSARPDDTVIGRFRTAEADAYLRLNRDFELSLTAEIFAHLQEHYRRGLGRDPKLGELRVLDALARVPRTGYVGDRHAVGELVTDNPAIADTWADLMAKHEELFQKDGSVPPCSYEDALALTTRYLCRTGRMDAEVKQPRKTKSPVPERVLILSPVQEMEAVAEGYRIQARIGLFDGSTAAIGCRVGTPWRASVPRTGEIILYASAVSAEVLGAFVENQSRMTTPDVKEMRVVGRHSLLETVCEFADGLELYVGAISTDDAQTVAHKLPIEALCAPPVLGEAKAAVLMRTSAKRMSYVAADLSRRGVTVAAFGQVTPPGRVVLRLPDGVTASGAPKHLSVADLKPGLLRALRGVVTHTCRLTADDTLPPSVTPLGAACLPGVFPAEDGRTPAGWETVALTALRGSVLFVREECMALAPVCAVIDRDGEGYHTALTAVHAATQALEEATAEVLDAGKISLSVSLHAKAGEDSRLVETICGLYRAAAEAGLPMSDPVLRLDASAAHAVEVTVIAHARAVPPTVEEDLQWNPYPLQSVSDPPSYLLPTLRRSMEGSLHALIRALNRRTNADCRIQPVVIEREEVEIPLDASVDPALEGAAIPSRTEMREILQPASVEKLVAALDGKAIPIFSMSASDAGRLLDHPAIRACLDARLQRRGTIVVLGDAVPAFAARGYLPPALCEVESISATGEVEVAYGGILAGRAPVRRPIRAELLVAPAASDPCLLTLTLPDGNTVSDGFVGADGQVLGLLTGVDAVTETILAAPSFVTANSDI